MAGDPSAAGSVAGRSKSDGFLIGERLGAGERFGSGRSDEEGASTGKKVWLKDIASLPEIEMHEREASPLNHTRERAAHCQWWIVVHSG